LITGVALVGLGLVPGLPTLMFVFCGLAFLFFGWCLSKEKEYLRVQQSDADFKPVVYSPLMLKLSPQAGMLLHQEGILPSLMAQRRHELFNRRGVLTPDLQFEIDHQLSNESCAYLQLNGLVIARVELDQGKQGQSQKVAQALLSAIETHLSELVNDTQTRSLLELHSSFSEDLVNSVVPEMVSVTELTTVLRQLVREQVCIREIPQILQAIAEYHTAAKQGTKMVVSGRSKDIGQGELLDAVRKYLGSAICQQIVRKGKDLEVFSLDAHLEQLIGDAALQNVPLSPALCEALRNDMEEELGQMSRESPIVLLTNRASRLSLFELLSPICSELVVLAMDEIDPAMNVQVVKILKIGTPESNSARAEPGSNVVSLARAA
jgi:flagellar biosynthesis component FlhA